MDVAVIGTGLIGGSFGLARRAAAPSERVVAFDPDPAALRAALELGAVTEGAPSAAAAVEGADLVVLALPVDRIPKTCWAIGHAVRADAVVTDVGSAKAQVVGEGESVFGGRFVGGHPMAGSERHGIEAADARLFNDAWWILTPTEATSSHAYGTVSDVVRTLGATPVAVAPEVHDALVARLSHVPQLTASALVEVAGAAGDREALLGLAAGGFRDVTRIAASNPDLWVAIIKSNRTAVLDALEGLGGRLAAVAEMISRDRWEELHRFLEGSRRARLEIFAKSTFAAEGEPVGLSIMVPDRPGVLAEVTTAAGELGVNIEDLRIVHSTEGGRGRLELVVAGATSAELIVGALMKLGYRVERSQVDL
jgi:prephenate dehydrogenase